MTPRPMRLDETTRVREIYASCHPDQPPRPDGWYVAYPTLVLTDDEAGVIGFISGSVSPGLTGTMTLYGNGLCVLPMYRKRGGGWRLAEARLALGRAVGAKTFIGITEASNAAMIRIFERQGFHACQRLPGYFGTEAGLIWAGTL